MDRRRNRDLQRVAEFRADARLSTRAVEVERAATGLHALRRHARRYLQVLSMVRRRLRPEPRTRSGEMRKWLLAACALACVMGAKAPAVAQLANDALCAGTVSPQISGLLAQFPSGGPGLRAAIAQL